MDHCSIRIAQVQTTTTTTKEVRQSRSPLSLLSSFSLPCYLIAERRSSECANSKFSIFPPFSFFLSCHHHHPQNIFFVDYRLFLLEVCACGVSGACLPAANRLQLKINRKESDQEDIGVCVCLCDKDTKNVKRRQRRKKRRKPVFG